MVSGASSGSDFRTETVQLDEKNIIFVAPAMGCNVFSWISEGKEVFFIPDDFFQMGDPLRGGNPVLFPSVGRTWKQVPGKEPAAEKYGIRASRKSYTMPCHGIASQGTWTKVSGGVLNRDFSANTAESASVSTAYEFTPNPEAVEKHYPFSVSLTLAYVLCRRSLTIYAVMRNTGDRPAPAAFGLHPYFRIEDKAETVINLPCKYRVMLHPELLIPDGRKQHLEGPIRLDPEKTYDMAFGGIKGENATIRDGRTGRNIHIRYNNAVSMFVLYSGKDTSFLCLEPWTSGLGGYASLSEKGWETRAEVPVIPQHEEKVFTAVYRISEEEDEPFG